MGSKKRAKAAAAARKAAEVDKPLEAPRPKKDKSTKVSKEKTKPAKPKEPALPPENSGPKGDAKKLITATRLSEEDKKALTDSGTTLFVAPPRTLQPRTHTLITDIIRLIGKVTTERDHGLVGVHQSGLSYLAAQYGTIEQRDAALKLLEREKVRHKEKSYELVVSVFGKDAAATNTKPAVWFVDCGVLMPKDLARALFAHFYYRSEREEIPKFEIRRVYDGEAPLSVFAGKLTPGSGTNQS